MNSLLKQKLFWRIKTLSLVLISSRMPKSLRQLQKDLDIQKDPIVNYNGSLVLWENQLFNQEILFSLLKKMAKYIEGTVPS